MKGICRILSLLLVMVMVFSLAPMPAQAARNTSEIININSGKSFKTKQYYYDNSSDNITDWHTVSTVYKLTIPQDSLVTITYQGTSDYSWIYFYTDQACKEYVEGVNGAKGTIHVVLGDGVYYIRFSKANDIATFIITPQSQINNNNFSKSKAQSLKTNTWVEIINSPNHTYNRWYKIKLTKKQKVKITTSEDAGYNVTIYNAKNKRVSVADGAKTIVTQKKLPKGTYYICVKCINRSYLNIASSMSYLQMKWQYRR